MSRSPLRKTTAAGGWRLHDGFADLGRNLYVDLWNGMSMEALDKFLLFWSGSGPAEKTEPAARRSAGHSKSLIKSRHMTFMSRPLAPIV